MDNHGARASLADAQAERRLTEPEAKALLVRSGIPVPKGVVIQSDAQLAGALTIVGTPAVVKLVSSDVSHKSDVGGVVVGVTTVEEAARATERIRERARLHEARVEGFLVEEMVNGLELIVGGLQDPTFGPVVLIGAGGVLVEVLDDVAVGVCPISRTDAETMIASLRANAILRGYRGRPPLAAEAVIDILVKLGGAAGLLLNPDYAIAELDINPLIVREDGAVATDARLVVAGRAMAGAD